MRSGAFDEVTIKAFAETMRKHLEREIRRLHARGT
jgi:hypothetical protein